MKFNYKEKHHEMINIFRFVAISLVATIFLSCAKQNQFLNAKSSNSLVTPSTISDYQAILDYVDVMNEDYPIIGLVGSDNYFLTGSAYSSLGIPENAASIWATDIWQGQTSQDWDYSYQIIEYANICLDGLSSLTSDTSSESAFNNVKGSALFFRAFCFYNLATIFCRPFDSTTASGDLGLPLRVSSDANLKYSRSTLAQTYTQIISDLIAAIPLLPTTPGNVTRPSSPAAYALLAKVYLDMGNYAKAQIYASDCLNLKNSLMDFNNTQLVTPGSSSPFPTTPENNPEIIFFAGGLEYTTVAPFGYGYVDTTLYSSYSPNDLRQQTFYYPAGGNQYWFAGTYDCYDETDFSGLATNEVYLIRAESYARLGNTSAALTDMNTILLKRFVAGTFQQLSAPTADSALRIILNERRKELPFTANIRWQDLRRLNLTPQYARTITRNINGQVYTLPANDPRYVYPIAEDEVTLTGIQQNAR